ncbi:hypothetical protein NDU88_001688 [Pleurodeles waltl]|uniref:DUF397 domain-containing protein n=1 Tax=Pleurodeles waltl TaxID=8319 RepID=A0AAV7TIG6_PLEWA|nr:hypothetical protein NDU88_001688 [Pleurodeles waltl]
MMSTKAIGKKSRHTCTRESCLDAGHVALVTSHLKPPLSPHCSGAIVDIDEAKEPRGAFYYGGEPRPASVVRGAEALGPLRTARLDWPAGSDLRKH